MNLSYDDFLDLFNAKISFKTPINLNGHIYNELNHKPIEDINCSHG